MLIVSSNCPKLVTPWQSYFHGYGEFLLMSLVTLLKFHCSSLNAKHLVWRFSSCFWLNRIFRSRWIFHPHFQLHRKWTAFDWQRVINCWLETQFNSTKNYLSSDFIIKKKFVLFVFQQFVHVFAISINESSICTWKASATNSSFNYASLVKCLLAFCCVELFCQYRDIDLVQAKFRVKFSAYALKRHLACSWHSCMNDSVRQKIHKNNWIFYSYLNGPAPIYQNVLWTFEPSSMSINNASLTIKYNRSMYLTISVLNLEK